MSKRSLGKQDPFELYERHPAECNIPKELGGRIQDFIANYRTGQISINFTQGKIANWNVHITERDVTPDERLQKSDSP